MPFVPTLLEVTCVHALQNSPEILSEVVWTSMSARRWRNLAETTQSARMRHPDTTASVPKDTAPSPTPKLPANRPMSTFCATATSIARTTPSALKDSASVKKGLRLRDRSVWISTSAVAMPTFAETARSARTFRDHTSAIARPGSSEHLHDSHAKRLVKTLSVARTPTASQKATKPFVFAKRAGPSFLQTFQKAASTSTSAMPLTDPPACAASIPFVPITTVGMSVRVHQASRATRRNNASISTSAPHPTLAEKTRFVRTRRDRILASALKERLRTLIQPSAASQLFRVRTTMTALVMQFVTPTSAACAQNRTSVMTAAILAKI